MAASSTIAAIVLAKIAILIAIVGIRGLRPGTDDA
jgi:hypothetical protein